MDLYTDYFHYQANKNLFNHDDLIRSPRAAPVVFSTNAHLNDVTMYLVKL